MNKNLMKKSKKLAYLLRHLRGAELKIESDGYASVSDILSVCDLSKNELDVVVETNSKKRFSYNKDQTKIRASQGHSISVDVGLEIKIPPVILYHGTVGRNIKDIMSSGLSKMNRLHVHLSDNVDVAIDVGSRHGEAVILVIDTKAMVKDGFSFMLSENGVWLVANIPPKYISKKD